MSLSVAGHPALAALTAAYQEWERVGARIGAHAKADPDFSNPLWPEWDRRYDREMTDALMLKATEAMSITGIGDHDLWSLVLGVGE